MTISALNFVNDGKKSLVDNSGQQWNEGNHYAVLVKNAHTPALTDTAQSDISANVCDSANYANQNVANKSVNESSGTVTLDCDDVDFTSGGANIMVARYCYIIQGAAGSPAGTDKVVGYFDLNSGGSTNVNVNAAIAINASGLITIA